LPEEFPLAIRHHADIEKRIKELGYRFIAMDMGGFRSGSLNEGLQPEQIQVVNIHSPH
jgi:PP-loop superfamily ATP-utilizing enzyme